MNKYRTIGKSIFGKPFMVFSLMLMAMSLPTSAFLMSVSQFLLAINFLAEGNFKTKLQRFKTDKTLWLFLLLPLLHVIWLFNTSDFSYAIRDLKIKVPLVIIPIIIALSDRLTARQIQTILLSFVFGVFCGSVVVIAVLTGIYPHEYNDVREAIFLISHIRFGLMMAFAIIIIAYYGLINYHKIKRIDRIGIILLILWFVLNLLLLKLTTSWVISIALSLLLFFIYYKKIAKSWVRRTLWIGIIANLLFWISLVGVAVYNFGFKVESDLTNLPIRTPYGKRYIHQVEMPGNENGYPILVYICLDELQTGWSKLSDKPIDGNIYDGIDYRYTLIRYMTSKGLTKDADGIRKLTPEDIDNIEKGYTSIVQAYKFIPYVKIYELTWELANYYDSRNANNMSLAQRFEYIKVALQIVKENFWFGVGTGDLQVSFNQKYDELNSTLLPENRHRAHNQYITFFIAFGVFGFLMAIGALFGPAILKNFKSNFLLTTFLLIVFLSMLNEDTLETQAGVTFFIFFYSLLLHFKKNSTCQS